MSVILAIDTSTEACSCALDIDGIIHEHFEIIPRQHATRLLPMIEMLMNEHALEYSALDAIAVGRGPGSFTGLRIATGVAQGIAFGAGLPVVEVSTLAALAMQAYLQTGKTHIFSCMDARIDEVYWGLFDVTSGVPELQGKEALCEPVLIDPAGFDEAEQYLAVGSGMLFLKKMQDDVQLKISDGLSEMLPHAADIAKLAEFYYEAGQTKQPFDVAPVYLRDKVTK